MAGNPFEQVLAALNAGRGLHLVVGGGAVVLHGHLGDVYPSAADIHSDGICNPNLAHADFRTIGECWVRPGI